MVDPVPEANSAINLKTLLLVYSLCSLLSVVITAILGFWTSMISLVISVLIFGFNLWGWIWSTELVFRSISGEKTSKLVQFFATLKFFLFLGSILLIFLAFGWVPVLVGNTLIVLSVLITTLLFGIYQNKDKSDG